MRKTLDEHLSSVGVAAISIAFVATIGWLDYLTGKFSLSIFYLFPICFAAWRAGRLTGCMAGILSAAVWLIGELQQTPVRQGPLETYWNAAVLGVIYCVVVHLLCAMHRLKSELEARVEQRTSDLSDANSELKIIEAERRRIGEDLHDSLGQKLTAASLTTNGLVLALGAARPELTAMAEYLGLQLRDAIAETRTLSHGLAPVSLQEDGLVHALHALADSTSRTGCLRCVFECFAPVRVTNPAVAEQLYRIAQEAVNNAVKHATAGEIRIGLERRGDVLVMEVEDDGLGYVDPPRNGSGIGIRAMKHRAHLMGGWLEIGSPPAGGAKVCCRISSPL